MEANHNFANEIKRIFLAEPFTEKGLNNLAQMKICLKKEDFFEKGIYIEPFSEYNKPQDKNITEDYDGIPYAEEISMNVVKTVKGNFENKISSLDGWLFIIKGIAGSGKTTYLNYLKNKFSNKIEFHIFNFEETKQSVSFMSRTFDLTERYSDNVCKVISLLLIEVANIIAKNGKNDSEHVDYIKRIVEVYNQSFRVPEDNVPQSGLNAPNMDIMEQQKLFNFLQEYATGHINYQNLSKEMLCLFEKKISSTNSDSALAFIAGFIIRLYYCLNKISGKKHLCVVDNIETFVKYDEEHPIQVCELEKIIKGFFYASHQAREILAPWKQLGKVEPFYSFLIVTRDTTASTALYEVQHEDDYKYENEIDISNWYCTEDILNKKKSFFQKNGVEFIDDCYSEAYQNMLSDFSAYHWGLSDIIDKMYKHSHRRNVECIPDAIAVIPIDEITFFNQMWKIAQGNESEKSSIKLMCRKYILRILIDHVQRKKYFDNLMVEKSPVGKERTLENVYKTIYDTSIHDESSSYARKISTILHRFALREGRDQYVSLPRIINSILKPVNLPGEPTNTQIRSLGKILFLMNETRNEITNWTSLVCMRYSNKEIYSENNLCNIMTNEWNKYRAGEIGLDDTTNFGVKITEAGSFFAKILSDFEYFSCRFLSNEPPLFSLKNIKPFYINGQKTFRAIAIIRYIRGKAFNCIEEVMERDMRFFASMDNIKKLDFTPMYNGEYSWLYKDPNTTKVSVHPDRILNQHMGYIANYGNYIDKYISEDKFEDPNDKSIFLSQLRKEFLEYKNKLNELMQNNLAYFNKA